MISFCFANWSVSDYCVCMCACMYNRELYVLENLLKIFFFFKLWHVSRVAAVVVQSLSPIQLFAIPWTIAHQASLSFTISHSLLKLMSTELVMLSNCLILCHPLLLLTSIFPSIRESSITQFWVWQQHDHLLSNLHLFNLWSCNAINKQL